MYVYHWNSLSKLDKQQTDKCVNCWCNVFNLYLAVSRSKQLHIIILVIKFVFLFTDECQTKYGNANAWRYCCKVFDLLTVAAVSIRPRYTTLKGTKSSLIYVRV